MINIPAIRKAIETKSLLYYHGEFDKDLLDALDRLEELEEWVFMIKQMDSK